MTACCPIHNKPLVQEHTSKKLICLPCYFAAARDRRNAVVAYTDPPTRRKEQKAKLYQDGKQREATG